MVEGVQKGAREGNKAAGPIGGVLGGAIGGVVGAVGGVVGPSPAATEGCAASPRPSRMPKDGAAKSDASKSKTAKGAKGQKQPAVLTQAGAPQLTAEQIVANSDANIERIKKELNLTPEQEKHWNGFNSAMHYLGHNGADRLNLRIARANAIRPTTSSSRCATKRNSSTTARSISATWPTPPSRCLRASTTSRSRFSSTRWCGSATSAGWIDHCREDLAPQAWPRTASCE